MVDMQMVDMPWRTSSRHSHGHKQIVDTQMVDTFILSFWVMAKRACKRISEMDSTQSGPTVSLPPRGRPKRSRPIHLPLPMCFNGPVFQRIRNRGLVIRDEVGESDEENPSTNHPDEASEVDKVAPTFPHWSIAAMTGAQSADHSKVNIDRDTLDELMQKSVAAALQQAKIDPVSVTQKTRHIDSFDAWVGGPVNVYGHSADGGPSLADDGGPSLADDGGPSLADGGPSLADGGPSLADGGPSLADGGPSLADGGPSLADGGPSLADGGPSNRSQDRWVDASPPRRRVDVSPFDRKSNERIQRIEF
uniref:Uncharacterized protein n=1 Tax=Strigamia maritima TaxID=126957 RepID=T1J9U2_STRMM